MGQDRQAILAAGIAALGLSVADAAQAKMLAYLDVMAKWNKVFNLTSRRDTGDWVQRHILDSLAVLPYINGVRVLDVGSGAGVPGIPLALAAEALQVTVLDSNVKKARFMTQALIELRAANVDVVAERVERYRPKQLFDCVISRAFASIADFLEVAGHLAAPGGRFLAMKGVYPAEELAQLPAGFVVEAIHPLEVPDLNAERHLVVIVRGDTPGNHP